MTRTAVLIRRRLRRIRIISRSHRYACGIVGRCLRLFPGLIGRRDCYARGTKCRCLCRFILLIGRDSLLIS